MRHVLPLLAALAACTGASTDDGPVDTDTDTVPSEPPGEEVASALARVADPGVDAQAVRALTAGDRAFALDLYQALRDRPGNLFLSPHSIATALSMTWAGAAGVTATELGDVLRMDAGEHAARNQLDLWLASREDVALEPGDDAEPPSLRVVNQTFGQTGYPFEAPYLDLLAQHYGAGMRLLDFGADPDGARGRINDWVGEVTRDRIVDLLPPGSISSFTKLVLVNAIWFKASWATPFPVDDTEEGAFTRLDDRVVQVPRMRAPIEQATWATGDGWTLVELDYVGRELTMTLVIPDAGRFDELEAGLDQPTFDAMVQAAAPAAVDLTLPRFAFRTELELVPTLQTLGVNDLFDPNAADLSPMSTASDLFVTGVFHQGWVAVDEKGTEAAAATAVVIDDTSVPDWKTVVVDRPFLLAIRDRPTGALLFLGRVLDPSE